MRATDDDLRFVRIAPADVPDSRWPGGRELTVVGGVRFVLVTGRENLGAYATRALLTEAFYTETASITKGTDMFTCGGIDAPYFLQDLREVHRMVAIIGIYTGSPDADPPFAQLGFCIAMWDHDGNLEIALLCAKSKFIDKDHKPLPSIGLGGYACGLMVRHLIAEHPVVPIMLDAAARILVPYYMRLGFVIRRGAGTAADYRDSEADRMALMRIVSKWHAKDVSLTRKDLQLKHFFDEMQRMNHYARAEVEGRRIKGYVYRMYMPEPSHMFREPSAPKEHVLQLLYANAVLRQPIPVFVKHVLAGFEPDVLPPPPPQEDQRPHPRAPTWFRATAPPRKEPVPEEMPEVEVEPMEIDPPAFDTSEWGWLFADDSGDADDSRIVLHDEDAEQLVLYQHDGEIKALQAEIEHRRALIAHQQAVIVQAAREMARLEDLQRQDEDTLRQLKGGAGPFVQSCIACGVVPEKRFRCGASASCGAIYCGQECAEDDWDTHKHD